MSALLAWLRKRRDGDLAEIRARERALASLSRTVFGEVAQQEPEPTCPDCGGRGAIPGLGICLRCDGSGRLDPEPEGGES